MLHDPELSEAHQTLQDLPPARLGGLELHVIINELVTVTMLLLRAVDELRDLHQDFRNLDATLIQIKAVLTEILNRIHRN